MKFMKEFNAKNVESNCTPSNNKSMSRGNDEH